MGLDTEVTPRHGKGPEGFIPEREDSKWAWESVVRQCPPKYKKKTKRQEAGIKA